MRNKPNHIAALMAAVLGVLVAWGFRLLLTPILGDRLPFITFFPMVFVLALWDGFWPAFYAAIFGSLVLDYAIMEPTGSFYIERPEYRVGLGVFAVMAIAIGWLGEQFHLARIDRQQEIEIAKSEG